MSRALQRGRLRRLPRSTSLLAVGGLLAGCATFSGAPPRTVGRSDASSREATSGTRGEDPRAARIVAIARSLLETPYRFGGASREGFDCSGFTAHVFARAGLALPRTAQEQAALGTWIPLDELAPGDLAFFGTSRERLQHVGLVVSPPGASLAIVHASKSHGVIETDLLGSAYWLGQLQLARRVLAH